MCPLESLDDWSLEVVAALVAVPDGEPAWFDFKEFGLTGLNNDLKQRVCRHACGMANSGGGFLVFGVKDKGTSVEEQMVGTVLPPEPRHVVGQIVKPIRPALPFDTKPLPLSDGKGIVVVHVMSVNAARPYMYEGDWAFYERGDGGDARAMTYQQVRDLMLVSEERRQRLQLLRIKLHRYLERAEYIIGRVEVDRLNQSNQGTYMHFYCFNTQFFDILVADVWGLLSPYMLVERMMEISDFANAVNNALNLALSRASSVNNGTASGLADPELQALESDLTELIEECRRCYERIEGIFGPLPAGTRY